MVTAATASRVFAARVANHPTKKGFRSDNPGRERAFSTALETKLPVLSEDSESRESSLRIKSLLGSVYPVIWLGVLWVINLLRRVDGGSYRWLEEMSPSIAQHGQGGNFHSHAPQVLLLNLTIGLLVPQNQVYLQTVNNISPMLWTRSAEETIAA
ncbi:MAG: hypothetical protein FRX49_04733 [Trebouxia sp. A1-2]|nr:MAG: hypothetical protein FRX49_04733 [Trebouxia sp. A1-2]